MRLSPFRILSMLLLSAAFALQVLFPACNRIQPLRIGISKASPNYINWIKRSDSTAIAVNLYTLPIDSAVVVLEGCSALLLTGGEDVYPGLYGKEADTARCTEMNRHRDSLEMALVALAIARKMPIFGICRGNQILNVCFGGKLIIDIPQDIPKDRDIFVIHQCKDYLHCLHSVKIVPGSLLAKISHCDTTRVTSNHHQAVERLSDLLKANAHAPDGLIEGIEWKNPAGRSFLLGVQWHPERMERSNPLSGPLADEFLRQAKQYSLQIQKNR